MKAAQAARAGFAIGWATATATHPLDITEQATDACRWVMTHGDPATVVEVSLRLGHLHGVWATIYHRREKLEARAMGRVTDAFASFHLDAATVVDTALRAAPATESTQPVDPGLTAAGADAAKTAIDSLTAPQRHHLRVVAHDNTLDATAEGQANAVAQLADAGAGLDISWDVAYQDGYDALSGLQSLWDTGDEWVTKTTKGLADEVGKALSRGWAQGLDRSALVDLTQGILDTGGRTAAYLTDLAIGQALAAGSLAVYQSAGLEQTDYLTAGDLRVCAECDDAEQGSPYSLDSAPTPPLHGMCRCTLAPNQDALAGIGDLSGTLAPYLIG